MDIKNLKDVAFKLTGEFQASEDCHAGSVACALLSSTGKVYTGICIESACGIGFCAEHAAIADMMKERETRIDMIIAVNKKGVVLPPCGRCRELILQVNYENRGTRVAVDDTTLVTLGELLPRPWQDKYP